jgi:hypothetical protein
MILSCSKGISTSPMETILSEEDKTGLGQLGEIHSSFIQNVNDIGKILSDVFDSKT